MLPIPLRAVTALFLDRQHLGSPRASALTARRLCRFVEDVGGLQIDSINVLERAHYLTLWSRFGCYDRAKLDRWIYDERRLFEYWAHAACLVPTSSLRWWRRAMLDYRVRHTGWSDWLRRNPKTIAEVQAAIRANGPMAGADFEGRRPAGGARGWWQWRPVHHALHYLWMTGVLTVHSRRNFQKRFELLERAIPSARDAVTVSSEAFARWHVARSLHAMGVATEADLAGYMTFPRFAPGVRAGALRAMSSAGEVTEIAVEGSPARWLALTRDLPALHRAAHAKAPARGTTLLSPFDSVLWYRERAARLFRFDYRIEVYTPAAKRVHGYYSLPILHDGQLIGRLDAKAERAARRLAVRHVHFEPWVAGARPSPADGARLDRDRALHGVSEALDSLAAFVGADRVTVERVTPERLRAPLLKAVALRGAQG